VTHAATPGPSTIGVTGATGALGALVVDSLLGEVPASSIVAIVRNASKAKSLSDRGVEVRVADYDDAAALQTALLGVHTLLLVSATELGQRLRQHTNVIEAAQANDVAHIVYTSAPRADDTPLTLAVEHAATEKAIIASGLPYTLLRNNWYHENYLAQVEPSSASGVLIGSTAGGTVASASRADLAAATATVLLGTGHEGKVYELGGDVAWDYEHLASVLSEVSGRPVVYRDLAPAEHVAALESVGLDGPTAQFVVSIDTAIAAGALSEVTGDLHRLLGRPTVTLSEGLRAASSG
jgi:NAD(P)H dehydrogenase (quinone)